MLLYLRFEAERLRDQFGVGCAGLPQGSGTGLHRAGSLVPAISWNAVGSPFLQLVFFGFSMREGVFPMTSHRSESIDANAPSQVFRECRCLIPVDRFGPQRSQDHGQGLPYGSIDDRMLAVAALLRQEDKGLAATILTVPGDRNERLPAIIREDDYDVWLDDTTPAKAALEMVRRSASDLISRIPEGSGSRRTS